MIPIKVTYTEELCNIIFRMDYQCQCQCLNQFFEGQIEIKFQCASLFLQLKALMFPPVDSRNELVRVALNGILKGGPQDRQHQQGSSDNSSRSNSESEDQVSGVSTMRDTEDIREVMVT